MLYVDTSALARVLLNEPGAPVIAAELSSAAGLVASRLARTELRRVALRTGEAGDAERILASVSLIPVTSEILQAAETIAPASVGTLDAIHLVTALKAYEAGALSRMITYDRRLADAAAKNGLTVVSP